MTIIEDRHKTVADTRNWIEWLARPGSGLALEAEMARRSLVEYVRQAWHVVRPGEQYVHGWHIDAICEHLEAITRGEIRNLIINVPPRHTKSLLTCVFWPTWTWIDAPWACFLTSSYAASLAIRDSLRSRRLLQSPWWQERWGESFSFSGDQNQKSRYDNNKGGYRIAVGVGGAATGEGGDFIIVDDPVKAADQDSDTALDTANVWWDETMATRANDPKTVSRIVIMQRLHERDLTGHLSAKMKEGGEQYEWLCLPTEYEPGRMAATAIGWADPRTEEGELLNPDRFGEDEVRILKTTLGERGSAGQLQQRPAPAGGAIFKRSWWDPETEEGLQNRYDNEDYRFWNRCVGRWLSFDTAFKDKEANDYTAMGVVELTADYRLALREMAWRRLETPQVTAWVETEARRWNRDGRLKGIIIEDRASGISTLQTLRQVAEGWLAGLLVGFSPQGSKQGRARQASVWCERGCVLLPLPGTGVAWLMDFEDEFLFKFPGGAFDDPVDALTQAVLYLEHYLSAGWHSRR